MALQETPVSRWTTTDELLANVIEGINALAQQQQMIWSKSYKPKPFQVPRPYDEIEGKKVKAQSTAAEVSRFRGRGGGSVRVSS